MKKAFKIGIIFAFCVGFILFLTGLIFNNFDIKSALETAKNGLVFILAILMFILAGMIMIKGKNPENKLSKSYFVIIILIILLFAAIIDYILFYI